MRSVALHNLGCKVNGYEIDVMQQMLQECGYKIVPFDKRADIYIVNTCTVTNIAVLVLLQRTGRTLINDLSRGGIVQAESPFRHVLHQSLLACSRLVSAVAVGHCIFSQVESPAVFRFYLFDAHVVYV